MTSPGLRVRVTGRLELRDKGISVVLLLEERERWGSVGDCTRYKQFPYGHPRPLSRVLRPVNETSLSVHVSGPVRRSRGPVDPHPLGSGPFCKTPGRPMLQVSFSSVLVDGGHGGKTTLTKRSFLPGHTLKNRGWAPCPFRTHVNCKCRSRFVLRHWCPINVEGPPTPGRPKPLSLLRLYLAHSSNECSTSPIRRRMCGNRSSEHYGIFVSVSLPIPRPPRGRRVTFQCRQCPGRVGDSRRVLLCLD